MYLSCGHVNSGSHTEGLFRGAGIFGVHYGKASAADEVCGKATVGVRWIVSVWPICPCEDMGEAPVSDLFLVVGTRGWHCVLLVGGTRV